MAIAGVVGSPMARSRIARLKMRVLLAVLCLVSMQPEVVWAEAVRPRLFCRGTILQRWDHSRRVDRLDHPLRAEPYQPMPRSLFNRQDLSGWSVIEQYDFARHGEITVEDDAIILGAGRPATGIRIDGDFPRMNYEVTLEARRMEGTDFFCGLTFPVGDDYLSLVLGGWMGWGHDGHFKPGRHVSH